MEHPVWKILKKEIYVEEFYPKAEEMYDFIQSLINITGNITENGETIPTMLKFFNMWSDYNSETFWILSELVHKNKIQWNDDLLWKEGNNMVRKINNRLYKVNTYASAHIIEIDDNYDEEVQKLRKEINFDSIGYKLNLFAYLAALTVQGYAILSVTEFNLDGSKPKVAYAGNKDYKKIVKYYMGKKA